MLNINYWKPFQDWQHRNALYEFISEKDPHFNHTESDSMYKQQQQCIKKGNVKLKGGKLKKGSVKRLVSLKVRRTVR